MTYCEKNPCFDGSCKYHRGENARSANGSNGVKKPQEKEPTVIKSFPAKAVDRHLRATGHLPNTDFCNDDLDCMKFQPLASFDTVEKDWQQKEREWLDEYIHCMGIGGHVKGRAITFTDEVFEHLLSRISHHRKEAVEENAEFYYQRGYKDAVIEDRKGLAEKMSDFFEGGIPFQGNWVTWQFYKDMKGITEFGHIGDAINGDIVHAPKYKEYFLKEVLALLEE